MDDLYTRGRNAPRGTADFELYAWIQDLHEAMDLLNDAFSRDRWPHSYQAPSLKRLEKNLHWYLGRGVGGDAEALFLRSVAGYLGETLLNQAGGRWGWDETLDDGAGLPVVRPDPALDLDPVVPLEIVERAVAERTGTVLAEEARRLRGAVRARKRRKGNAGWEPERLPTPWIARENLESFTMAKRLLRWGWYHRNLHRWSWAEEAGGGEERWNYRPESLDALDELLHERFRSAEEYNEAAGEEFWLHAAWYAAECVVMWKKARWQYLEPNPQALPGTPYAADNHWTGAPFIRQRFRFDGHAEHPRQMLRAVFAGHRLREVAERFPDPVPGDYGY
ncbi:hypothetical protein LN042_22445 [Kitasatospora sp. RB6PN24]|uniref:hypothetical protein n=1 Tax=Kitasatospora humi TaxID=2893891 RepID=UPI001E5217C6|nr:hypothetical protein [Kitasatospora humi]MCC9309798.1 hypothetical protein [Kitasatospora humi]